MHNGYCEHTSQLTPMPLESEETSTLTRDHNQDQAREKAGGEQAWESSTWRWKKVMLRPVSRRSASSPLEACTELS